MLVVPLWQTCLENMNPSPFSADIRALYLCFRLKYIVTNTRVNDTYLFPQCNVVLLQLFLLAQR